MAKVLVTGGAGYVGSSVAVWLKDRGHEVTLLDNLVTGHREFARGFRFVLASVGSDACRGLLEKEQFDAVLHFAASTQVGESVQFPERYFENNVEETRRLLQFIRLTQTRRFVFSSTCAIFGNVGNTNISEDLPRSPLSPYGVTKLRVEGLLEEASQAWGLQAIALRYFNASGAEASLRVGEWHEPETHLIPNIFRASLEGRSVSLYGTDYPTPDGTCIRDYIHVSDLAEAHESALQLLIERNEARGFYRDYNLGSERGYSVREVIDACQKVLLRDLGREVPVIENPRRPGDAPRLVGDSSRARKELGYTPRHSLQDIVESAWAYERKRRTPRPAALLDRDGTINIDPGYISRPEDLHLLPGAGEALGMLAESGFALVVVSNQSGVGRGLIPRDAIPQINARINELISPFGAKIESFQMCFHTPTENCLCRKPGIQLITQAVEELRLDLKRSIFVGDRDTDLKAGRTAGCGRVFLVRTGDGRKTEAAIEPGACDAIFDDLLALASTLK
jgi:UDP-glucose 4-epimerase